ncbi:hypothetical protein HELRODRAFT_184851 [Helobdella robusta]|uniref:NR LBD domain-containing protein n=1 Tax=Helobdella robusta TaxID=6412 RepID=T1FM30_HELRO|nr:hypothetical protein HELRODRAFT_184851 [Helobdella robusta]ESO12853.1 hypothetical protein HELRODRAFT_184851 [Helobdella robusta]
MIFCHKLFNVEHMLYTTQSGKVAHVDDMKRMKNCEFLDAMFHLEGYLQRMQLSVEETCIMGAVCVMFPDTCNLQDPHLVEKSQNLVLECLYYLFRKYHPEDKLRFAHFISCVLQMRTLKEIQMREEEAFVMEWGGKVEIPKLVYEIWSS